MAEATQRDSWWGRAAALAGLTAALTVAVAISAFLSAQAASDSAESFATSANALTDANFFFNQGVAGLTEDVGASDDVIDRACLLSLFAEGTQDLCEGDLEEIEALAAEDPVLSTGAEFQAVADAAYEDGLAKSEESVDYQAALVVLALGLALSAWASLSERSSGVRLIFGVVAVVALAVGVIWLVTI